jgi:hypothetical protein
VAPTNGAGPDEIRFAWRDLGKPLVKAARAATMEHGTATYVSSRGCGVNAWVNKSLPESPHTGYADDETLLLNCEIQWHSGKSAAS